ncbi:MAG TPA: hypothetical protein VL326_24905 [Kofleriaceae bacterium]|nr:hypothetical protein [Kofleriaceae bacterium]
MDRRWLLVACCALAGCKQLFGLDDPTTGAANDARIDTMNVPDAGTCTGASAMCLGDTLRTCGAAGEAAVDTACTWGCGTSTSNPASHCQALVPAGDGAVSSDLTDTMGVTGAVTLNAGIIVDSDTGRIGTTLNPSSIRAPGTGIISGIDFQLHNGVGVLRMYLLTVNGPVSLVGSHSIALVSISDVVINDVIDARGTCLNRVAGPGGFAGGAIDASGFGTGAGKAKTTIAGGGGAGYGGAGGDSGPYTGANAGGVVYGDAAISKLVGGSGGGGASDTGANSGIGGGGGGAVQVLSNTFIQIGAAGGINAGGCGGKAGAGGNDGGGGGGSGGTIVLEAPQVIVNGALAVNGGAGGTGGGGTGYGESGRLDRMQARPPASGTYAAGSGGAAAIRNGGDGGAAGNGGGGGGVGRMRFTTRDDMGLTIAGVAVLSPSLTDTGTTCTRAASVTQ